MIHFLFLCLFACPNLIFFSLLFGACIWSDDDDDDQGPTLFEWEASVGDGGDEPHPARTRIHRKWICQHLEEEVSAVDVRSRMDCHLLTLVLLKNEKDKGDSEKGLSSSAVLCLPYNVEDEEAPHTQKIDVPFLFFRKIFLLLFSIFVVFLLFSREFIIRIDDACALWVNPRWVHQTSLFSVPNSVCLRVYRVFRCCA